MQMRQCFSMVMLKCCRELKHAINDKNFKQNHVAMSQTCKIGHRKIQKNSAKITEKYDNKNHRKIEKYESQCKQKNINKQTHKFPPHT